MPNSISGPYVPTSWTDGVTIGTQVRMNNLETSSSVALHGLNPDLAGPFVYSGITCAKDGTNANQLDIAPGVAYVTLSDGTIGRVTVVSDNTHTTSTPSTTYYLFLKNDGTWQWGTSSSGPANSLAICQATTDGAGNISVVTDKRTMAPAPLLAGADVARVPVIVARAIAVHVTSTAQQTIISYAVPVTGFYRMSGYVNFGNTTNQAVDFEVDWWDGSSGAAQAHTLFDGTQRWNGSNTITHGASYGFEAYPIYAQTGHNIFVFFTDPAGAPNDFVTATIERLS